MPTGLFDTAKSAPEDLALMLNTLRAADDIYKPSPFWEQLALTHVQQLETEGFANFKRTVNLRYFNWSVLGILAHQLIPLGRWWLAKGRGSPLNARVVRKSPDDVVFGRISDRIYST